MSEQQPEDASAQSEESPGAEGTSGAADGLDQGEPGDVGDAQLPADLQPTEDNPLARHPGQSGEEDDEIGSDREGEAERAPMSAEDADYGGTG